jgi:hypothetical protein
LREAATLRTPSWGDRPDGWWERKRTENQGTDGHFWRVGVSG